MQSRPTKITGQTVKVTTKRMGDASSEVDFYHVAEAEPYKAAEIVSKAISATPDQIVEAVAPLPKGAVE
ncbi:MAG TPA: hypothetical protein PKM48_14720, partial [Parvularculaceae bacterium]|nr:hypothetical protein [Parvularculaceae bacterium]